jgi:HNH endonuclease
MKRRVQVGAAARRRVVAGGPRAIGRPAATRAEWAEIRLQVLARASWTCQACGVWGRRLDVHHVIKRARGGSDFDLDQLVALCRACHEQTDAPSDRGRLIVTPLGGGQFTCEVVQRVAKWRRHRDVADSVGGGLPHVGKAGTEVDRWSC